MKREMTIIHLYTMLTMLNYVNYVNIFSHKNDVQKTKPFTVAVTTDKSDYSQQHARLRGKKVQLRCMRFTYFQTAVLTRLRRCRCRSTNDWTLLIDN